MTGATRGSAWVVLVLVTLANAGCWLTASIGDLGDAGPAGHWCERQTPSPRFCADFDEVSDLSQIARGWTSAPDATNAVAKLDNKSFSSSPNSLDVRSVRIDPPGHVLAMLTERFPERVSHVHFAYDLRLDTVAPNASVATSDLAFLDSGGGVAYELTLSTSSDAGATTGNLEEAVPSANGLVYSYHSLSAAPLLQRWVRLSVDVVPPSAGHKGRISVYLGSDLVLDFQPAAGAAGGVPALSVGLEMYPEQSIGACEVHIDNVTLDADP